MKKLSKYLDELEAYIPAFKIQNTAISKSTVGWQVDHSLKVINGVVETLKKAPTNKRPNISMYGRVFLALRYFPRGKARAPKYVLPPETIEKEALEKQLDEAKKSIQLSSSIHPKVTFKHPYFGVLNRAQTITFIEVHTKHHLKIIRDILN